MLDHLTLTDLPTAPLDLSHRMRELRARLGLKQSEVARRIGLDPSIPSLWEQGKRPVPANRVASLAEALGVSLSELLEGVSVPPGAPLHERPTRESMLDRDLVAAAHTYRGEPLLVGERMPLMTLVGAATRSAPLPEARAMAVPLPPLEIKPKPKPFVPQPRPTLTGTIPAGWEPSERVRDIGPALPDGYWLDPVRLERPAARALLASRLCVDDRAVLEAAADGVPGAATAERIYRHCSREEGFQSGKVPLVEAIFRLVLASEEGGLTVDDLIAALEERSSAVPPTRGLLRGLREPARAYPLRWVDRELFGE